MSTEGRDKTSTSARANTRVPFPTFLKLEKTGNLRPILDLRSLKKTISVQSFRMESLQSVAQALTQGNLMLSLDLKDAYLHIPVFLHFHKYLGLQCQTSTSSSCAYHLACPPHPECFPKFAVSNSHCTQARLDDFHCLDDILLVVHRSC